MKVAAIFDIGKTNKKFFLFDEQLREVYRAYTCLEESTDEDGFPCENLSQLAAWMNSTFQEALARPEFDIRFLNFSTYGASLVHLDESGNPVAPLYNYLKPMPEPVLADFFTQYGPPGKWAAQTASPVMGMLNSGLQLYWLKYRKPETFNRIRHSLHLPQYCALLFSGRQASEYTSIGCHTGLWDFRKKDYHPWVYSEGINRLFPPILPAAATFETTVGGKALRVGIGIHDSSAALLPYIMSNTEPFLLISTGTWSITLNPFSTEALSESSLQQDCLSYLRMDGLPVRAARLFLGNEYEIWVQRLAAHFQKPYESHRQVSPDEGLLRKLERFKKPVFLWESIRMPGAEPVISGEKTDPGIFSSYEEAYHQLIRELTGLQIKAIHLARGNSNIRKIYIDGGFADNELFVQLLARQLDGYELVCTESPLGSAQGAALAAGHWRLPENALLQKQKSLYL